VKKVLACVAAVAAAALALLGGCTTNDLVAKGGACFQAIDCQAGLVCIYANDAGTCSDDLSSIVNVPETGSPDAPAQQDAPVGDAPADQVAPQDTGVQDTGVQDTGAQDTGASDAADD
jgi:hypothetical protein